MRRLLAIIAVIGGVAVPAVPAAAATADCTGPRVLSVVGARVTEGTVRGGYTTLTFTVNTTGCTQQGLLRYQTVGYSAREKLDYLPTSGNVEYAAGQTGQRTVAVQVVADAVPEQVECFSLQIAVASGTMRADPAEAAGFILDDDLKGAGRGFRCSE